MKKNKKQTITVFAVLGCVILLLMYARGGPKKIFIKAFGYGYDNRIEIKPDIGLWDEVITQGCLAPYLHRIDQKIIPKRVELVSMEVTKIQPMGDYYKFQYESYMLNLDMPEIGIIATGSEAYTCKIT